jgi:hypothetical protein
MCHCQFNAPNITRLTQLESRVPHSIGALDALADAAHQGCPREVPVATFLTYPPPGHLIHTGTVGIGHAQPKETTF